MNFSSIVGHDALKKRLSESIISGRVPHAQLFVGDVSSGALPLAVAYARGVLCPEAANTGLACGVCPTCYKTERLEHPDLNFIYPVNKSKKARATGRADEKPTSDQFIHLWREFFVATGGTFTEREWLSFIDIENQQGNINKEEATELLRKMSFKSYEGGYKVVVVFMPERMNATAANALLKLIEEPPAQTLFLFVATEPEKLLSTIRSRVQTMVLPSIGLKSADEQSAELYDAFVSLMRLCYTSKYLEIFSWAERMATLGREAQKAFCVESIGLLRACYLTGVGLERLTQTEAERAEFIRKFAPFVNHLSIEALVAEFELLGAHIKQNGNGKMLFTHFGLTVIKILGNVKSALAAGQ